MKKKRYRKNRRVLSFVSLLILAVCLSGYGEAKPAASSRADAVLRGYKSSGEEIWDRTKAWRSADTGENADGAEENAGGTGGNTDAAEENADGTGGNADGTKENADEPEVLTASSDINSIAGLGELQTGSRRSSIRTVKPLWSMWRMDTTPTTWNGTTVSCTTSI